MNGAVANTDYALNVSGSGYISDKLVFASEFEDKIYFNGAVYKIAVEVNTLVFDVGANRHIDFRYDGGDIFSIGYDGIDVTGNADISGNLEAQDTTINQYGIGVNGAVATSSIALNVTGNADISGDLEAQDTTINQYGIGVNGSVATSAYALNVSGAIKTTRGRCPTNKIHGDGVTANEIFDAIQTTIPNNDDEIIVSGSIVVSPTFAIVSYAKRVSSTTVTFYCVTSSGVVTFTVADGGVGTFDVSLAW